MLEHANMSFSLLDSLDSDADSLVQEKAYQLELQKRIGRNVNIKIEENGSDDPCLTEENFIYDSLEATPFTVADDRTARTDEEVTSDDSDEYADLRYDPDWRRNFEEARLFHELRTRLSLEEDVSNVREESEENLGQLRSLAKRRGRANVHNTGHRAVCSGGPTEAHITVEKPSSVPIDLPASSFHLHPPEHRGAFDSSSASSQTQSPPASTVAVGGRLNRAQQETGLAESQRQCDRAIPEGHDPAPEPPHQGEEATGRVKDNQVAFPLSRKSCSHKRSDVRPAKPRKDVVEQNRMTLGMNPSKQGSYLRMYGKKRDQPEQTDEAQESPEDSSTDRQESQEDESLDLEHLWLQRTQRLKVTQYQGERKSQPKGGNCKPLRQNRPKRTQVAQTRRGLSPLADSPSAGEDPHPQAEVLAIDEGGSSSNASNTPPLRPPRRSPPPASHCPSRRTPTVNLNINLNTAAARELSPHISRDPPDGLVLVSPRAAQWLVRPPAFYPAPFPGVDSSPSLPSPRMAAAAGQVQWAVLMAAPSAAPASTQRGLDMLAPPNGRKGNSTGAHVWGLSQNSERVTLWQPNADVTPEATMQTSDHSLRSSQSTGSSGPYAVLPPIGRPEAEEHERVSDRAQNGVMTIGPRSCSDGYLAQLEKQKQMKAQAQAYKEYTLKDYKSLKQNVRLGGLGPSNAVTETTAEKIRRQKLYSEVIRQQNKKISRIPFLPTQAQAQAPAHANKDPVPRRKALEYARTIAKPKASPRPRKEFRETKAVPELAGFLSGVDVGQLTLLESLRKRHEQEKQAVAQFKAVHAV